MHFFFLLKCGDSRSRSEGPQSRLFYFCFLPLPFKNKISNHPSEWGESCMFNLMALFCNTKNTSCVSRISRCKRKYSPISLHRKNEWGIQWQIIQRNTMKYNTITTMMRLESYTHYCRRSLLQPFLHCFFILCFAPLFSSSPNIISSKVV